MSNNLAKSDGDIAQPGLRERKHKLLQTTIEAAALRLFLEKGYEQTSVQDIADAVIISPRTFFRYFASKDELIFAPLRALVTEGIDHLQQTSPMMSIPAALTDTFVHIAELFQQQQAQLLTLHGLAKVTPSLSGSILLSSLSWTEPALCQALNAHLKATVNQVDIRFLVAIYMAILRMALMMWLENEAKDDLVTLLREHLARLSYL